MGVMTWRSVFYFVVVFFVLVFRMSDFQVDAAAPRMSYFQVNAVSIQATARLRRDACTVRGCAARVQGAKKMSHLFILRTFATSVYMV